MKKKIKKRKIKLLMVILIFLSLSIVVLLNTKYIENICNHSSNKENSSKNTPNIDISIDNDALIQQWYLENNGSFSSFICDDEAWGKDEKKAVKNIDIDYDKGIQFFSQKRKVIVSVIDTEIDVNHYALRNHIWKNTQEKENDKVDNDNNGYIDDYIGWNFYDNNNILFNKQNKQPWNTYFWNFGRNGFKAQF